MAPSDGFKPNIYPIMYWALAFGAAAGVLLFILSILSRFITLVWFPVFVVGLVWGGYRNYQKQRREWQAGSGIAPTVGSPVSEFTQAVRDITNASRDLMAEQADTAVQAPVAPETSATDPNEEVPPEEQPPVPPQQV